MKKDLYQIGREMEAEAYKVCEECGAPGVFVEQGGWQYTLCGRCAALSQGERLTVREETMERYYHSARLRTGEPINREKVKKTRLSDYLDRQSQVKK